MNWKIVVGVIIILGGISEMFAIQKDYNTGVTTGSPLYGQFGCVVVMLLGFWLIKKGREKKSLK